jgi:hypothetical protein
MKSSHSIYHSFIMMDKAHSIYHSFIMMDKAVCSVELNTVTITVTWSRSDPRAPLLRPNVARGVIASSGGRIQSRADWPQNLCVRL